MADYIIGLDIGNQNGMASFVQDLNTKERGFGLCQSLMNPQHPTGMPTCYFYSKNLGTKIGYDAIRTATRPKSNRVYLLKRNMDKKIQLGDRTIAYSEMLTQVIQFMVREANVNLERNYRASTNLVTIAYPAAFSDAQIQYLIELTEEATLADGRKLKVMGTIAEPAAAALSALHEFAAKEQTSAECTAVCYDLGAGSFDLAVVQAYLNGKKDADGNVYFYDIRALGGKEKLGGEEFTRRIAEMLRQKIIATGTPVTERLEEELYEQAEDVKLQLSETEKAYPVFQGCFEEIKLSRRELEQDSEIKVLVQQTIDTTRTFLQEYQGKTPDYLILTGGAAQMPLIENSVRAAFPQFGNNILIYSPSMAISYGAARFGVLEVNTDPVLPGKTAERKTQTENKTKDKTKDKSATKSTKTAGVVKKRIPRSIGILYYYEDKGMSCPYIETVISSGSELPFYSAYATAKTRGDETMREVQYEVYEAITANPDCDKIRENYRKIMTAKLSFGKRVQKGTECEARICIDRLGVLRLEGREKANPSNRTTAEYKLKNLSVGEED